MSKKIKEDEFDVILVGSGTCSATIARELVKQNKKVLILEQGANIPLRDTVSGIVAIAREYSVGTKLKTTTAVTTGGATSLYFGVCKLPTSETFAKLGIDLSKELEEVKGELPIAQLPEEFMPVQSTKFQRSAQELGYSINRHLMLIDKSKCKSGYSYEAKWKAKSYIEEAVDKGATLVVSAVVEKIIVEDGQAVGVEYKVKQGFMRKKICNAYGKRIVLSAGAFGTPKLLIDCGIKNIGDRGFFCKPGFMVCGTIPGMKGKDAFVGSCDIDLGNGVALGDGTMNSSLFKIAMLSNFKWRKIFSHSETITAGILLNDTMGGELKEDGNYYKQFTEEEYEKLNKAEQIAIKILENAGASNIFKSNLVAGIPGGLLRVKEHLDENLQTKIKNLYVCDHTVMSDVKITPTITLICLGKYLAKHLISSLQHSKAVYEKTLSQVSMK